MDYKFTPGDKVVYTPRKARHGFGGTKYGRSPEVVIVRSSSSLRTMVKKACGRHFLVPTSSLKPHTEEPA